MVNGKVIWQSIGVTLVAGLLIAAVWFGVSMRPTSKPCTRMTFVIEDRAERLYLTEAELTGMLQEARLYPVGRPLDRQMLHRIERAVAAHPMVRTAECFATPNHEVRVYLTQRVPLLRVQLPGDSYFIDTDRRVMPVRNAVKDSVLVVTGAVGAVFAATQAADFALWLQHNNYWRKQVHHLYVQSPQMICLYLKQRPRIVLGTLNDYQRKLAKMRRFFDNGQEALQDKHYIEYDARFRGQVIGRKDPNQ